MLNLIQELASNTLEPFHDHRWRSFTLLPEDFRATKNKGGCWRVNSPKKRSEDRHVKKTRGHKESADYLVILETPARTLDPKLCLEVAYVRFRDEGKDIQNLKNQNARAYWAEGQRAREPRLRPANTLGTVAPRWCNREKAMPNFLFLGSIENPRDVGF